MGIKVEYQSSKIFVLNDRTPSTKYLLLIVYLLFLLVLLLLLERTTITDRHRQWASRAGHRHRQTQGRGGWKMYTMTESAYSAHVETKLPA